VAAFKTPEEMNWLKKQGNHQKLIREARALVGLKGHVLREFILTRIDTGHQPVASRGAMTAICEKCGAYVGIDPAPPTGISKIWGNALERECLRKKGV
jgi:hypothetical protein